MCVCPEFLRGACIIQGLIKSPRPRSKGQTGPSPGRKLRSKRIRRALRMNACVERENN